jgi:hypothetical protein
MIILTQQSAGTNTAQIRTDKDHGFRILYRASSTASEQSAARAVVRKYFGSKAAATVARVPNEQINQHILVANNRKRCNPVAVWTFNQRA